MKEILIFCINSLWITALIGSLIGLIALSIGVLIGNLTFYISEFIKKKIKNFKHRFDEPPTGIWVYNGTERKFVENKQEIENEQEKA